MERPTPAAAATRMPPVVLEGVGLTWSGATSPLLRDFSLSLGAGRLTALVGPSGCGKSTLLRLIAGLLDPDAGRVEPGRQPPGAAAFVFQQPTLLPWRSVADNVALPLQLIGVPHDERQAEVSQALADVELSDAVDLLPGALSGGMRMRVSLARAWVGDPRLVLLDEPFAALDALTRRRVQARFLAQWEERRPTAVLVTHDIDEALLLADRVVVLGGEPLQVRADVDVPLARPRGLAMRHDPALAALAAQVEAVL